MPTLADFLARALDWPKPGEPGFVNLHWRSWQGKGVTSGRPFKELPDLLSFVQWAIHGAGKTCVRELYFCTSLQNEAGPPRKPGGPATALRNRQNTLRSKLLFADIDKGYATPADALNAVVGMCRATNSPWPSAVVQSGNGLHVYWINKVALLPEEWDRYAHGLDLLLTAHGIVHDPVTTDITRILRPPGTFNNKGREAGLPPKPVKLLLLGNDVDFTTWAVLNAARPSTTTSLGIIASKSNGPIPDEFFVDPSRRSDRPSQIILDSLKPEDRIDNVIDPTPVFACPMFKNTLATHGDGIAQPLWHQQALACTFLRDGEKLFHELSSGHKDYSLNETEAMFARKVRDRIKMDLGYPSCAQFEKEGCKDCASCALKGTVKSPLNLRAATAIAVAPAQPVQPQSAGLNATAGVSFRDLDRFNRPKPSLANAVIAIRALGIEASYDLFHHRIKVKYNGDCKTIYEGLLTDDTVSAARSLINNTYQIDCGDANTLAAIKEIASENAYDPVLDMLDECQRKWDGVKRLDAWVIDYLGCEDTPLNRAIGRKVLIGACRRARVAGCKFDTITVLEGVEGTNKSTAIRVLAGDEHFSDQSILGTSDKEVQEQLDGVWMHENADLAGMKRADVEHVKAFASRQVDRARPAYGRVREDRPRRSIEWGTTNNDEYLLSQTGNRRFWLLKTGKIDIESLKHDRALLLGEAATYEAAGESITLDPSLWGDAREAQEKRRVADPWEDILRSMVDTSFYRDNIAHRSGDGYERVASADVLCHVLGITRDRQTTAHGQRLALAMKHVGWDRNPSRRVTIKGVEVRGYIRFVGQDKAPTVEQAHCDAAPGIEPNAKPTRTPNSQQAKVLTD